MKSACTALEIKKAEFMRARRNDEHKKPTLLAPVQPGSTTPIIKFKPAQLPIFSGCKGDFHRWRLDCLSLQKQGEPTGSPEVKKIQLLNSVDEKITKDLRLSSYTTAEDIFIVLENRYGHKYSIALEIVEELEKIPPVRGNQPRKVVDLIQAIEKALTYLYWSYQKPTHGKVHREQTS